MKKQVLLLMSIVAFSSLIGCSTADKVATETESQDAIKKLSLAAQQGETNAQNKLGSMYLIATEGSKNTLEMFKKVIGNEHSYAQDHFGVLYRANQGTNKDVVGALEKVWQSAEKGDMKEQNKMGIMYFVANDASTAVVWFRKAAEQGFADAQQNLAGMYLAGKGVVQDNNQALTWYRKAAEQGHAGAQAYLGSMYLNGKGTERDDVEAVKWFRKAAEQGDTQGQNMLKGVAIFAKDCFGHPSPSNRQKLNATNRCLRRPSRPASPDGYPARGIHLVLAMTRRDFVKPTFSLRKNTLRENIGPIASGD